MFSDLLNALKSGATGLIDKVFPAETINLYADNPPPQNLPQVTPTPTETPIPTPTVTPPPDKAALPYYERINEASQANNLPDNVLYRLLKKESMGFNPNVIGGTLDSPKGAQGIAQFMPETSEWLGVDPLNVSDSINASGKYLADQLKTFGDIEMALAAYNAGPGNVRKFDGIPPFEETQRYVKDILGIE